MFKKNYNLEKLNTFKIPSKAKNYFCFTEESELDQYAKTAFDEAHPWFVLGGGSNVLFSADFDGVVIHPIKSNVEVLSNDKKKVTVRAYSGLEWDVFVGICVDNGWQGIENLTLIPGNVGACPVQNIGAYGTEVCEYIDAVNCYDLKEKCLLRFENEECEFTYRDSLFKRRPELIVLSVDFKLFSTPFNALFSDGKFKGSLKALPQLARSIQLSFKSIKIGPKTKWKLKMNFQYVREFLSLNIIPPALKRRLVRIIRTKTMPDPKKIGNVGCFFKSPIVDLEKFNSIRAIDSGVGFYPFKNGKVKVSAGDLIKSCKWNGKRVGEVSVEANRPLIVLNHGGATGAEIREFSENIQTDVYKKFSVTLEPEVVITG
ncbi:FAD-binding protein [Colwellia psychrerythraea]|uniref:UDP-N-acetylenolpyruvoylglucosamine reductase n=1 Tax=Colwellia psychrerythraea TaxID=28229 RepID=A0A099KGS0_COLPS|nr:FAD-binding protein [Colwellia psychrerythraea]KGJ88818.1 UDP-N-acetylenolpyruvoylglucosamine reductase [Colwellia psychrerythraea]